MAKGEVPLKGGDEYDALTRWKRFLNWRPGIRALIKKRYNKRLRKTVKAVVRREDKE